MSNQMTKDDILCLVLSFTKCISPNIEQVREGEQQLEKQSTSRVFVQAILYLIQCEEYDISVRQLACIYLKNFLSKHWDVGSADSSGLQSEDRLLIQNQIIPLIVLVSRTYEKQLGSHLIFILESISATDFPHDWKNLVSHLVDTYLNIPDIYSIYICTKILHHILKIYRVRPRSNEVLSDLCYDILPHLQEPLLNLTKRMISQCFSPNINIMPQSNQDVHLQLSIGLYCCQLVHTLISIDLPEYIEDHLQEFFQHFQLVLDYDDTKCTTLFGQDSGIFYEIKMEICAICTIFASNYNEEFMPYVHQFVLSIVQGMLKVRQDLNNQFITSGMTFLSSVAKYHWSPSPFLEPTERLSQLCSEIIIPQLQLNENDLEMLEDNPRDFIRLSLEGEDGTRRATAISLIQSLNICHSTQLQSILPTHLVGMFDKAKQATTLLEQKKIVDAIVHLFIAMTVRTETRIIGVTRINSSINLEEFLQTYLLGELEGSPGPEYSIGCSAVMKFIWTFRNQLNKTTILQLYPILLKCLTSNCSVIHTHACYCINQLMTARDKVEEQSMTLPPFKFTNVEISSFLLSSLEILLKHCLNPNAVIPDNEYLLQCINRILIFLKDQAKREVLLPTLECLSQLLQKQAKNAGNPSYCHYLFECLAVAYRASAYQQLQTQTDNAILETMSSILNEQDSDLYPYVLQVLGLVVDHATSASPIYLNLFTNILNEEQWTTSVARVPGLIRVLAAYFRKHQLFFDILKKSLPIIVERFQYCMNHKRLGQSGFDLLFSVLQHLPLDILEPYIQIWMTILIQKCYNQSPSKFTLNVSYACALIDVRSPSSIVPKVLSTMPPGVLEGFISKVYLLDLETMTKTVQKKKVAILALFKLMTSPEVICNVTILGLVLEKIASLIGVIPKSELSRVEKKQTAQEELEQTMQEQQLKLDSYDGSFNALQGAKISAANEEINEVSSFPVRLRECITNPNLIQQVSNNNSWQMVFKLIESSIPVS